MRDVHTIASYDPEIIPFLDAPIVSASSRKNGTAPPAEVQDFQPPAELRDNVSATQKQARG
jgi:hypothetical protein